MVVGCGVVGNASGALLKGYFVDGWEMTNYPTPNMWKGYYLSDAIKWDEKGYVENPLQPYAGSHELILFLDYGTGDTSFGSVVNYGPVTAAQRGANPVTNNFPPDYTIVRFNGDFNPSKVTSDKKVSKARKIAAIRRAVKQQQYSVVKAD